MVDGKLRGFVGVVIEACSVFLAFKHKDTEAETKGKALLLFGYLTKKPRSYVLGAVFICDVH